MKVSMAIFLAGLLSVMTSVAPAFALPTVNEIEAKTHELVNNHRATHSLPVLTRNSAVDNQARIHSQNMASGRVGFGHTGFSDRLRATGLCYRSASENVAYNYGYADPASEAVRGWLASSGHHRNIDTDYSVNGITGVGVAINSRNQVYFTQIFIKPC